jgi:hypothetical protein
MLRNCYKERKQRTTYQERILVEDGWSSLLRELSSQMQRTWRIGKSRANKAEGFIKAPVEFDGVWRGAVEGDGVRRGAVEGDGVWRGAVKGAQRRCVEGGS